MDKNIQTLQSWIDQSSNIVFFGGAGVSTESGIPDFRSVDGLYHQKFQYPPEMMLSHSFLISEPEEFYRFYHEKMLALWAKPNAAHFKLAELEQAGKLSAVITQNIDGLHYAAGSQEVLELHGSVHRNFCLRCSKKFSAQYVADSKGIPVCDVCGGMVRPDVVLYEESLNEKVMNRAIEQIEKADLMIIGGTSLVVYPAAGLINYFHGSHLVLLNKTVSAMGSRSDLVITSPIGEVFSQITVSA
ncbi:MAG: NAD-dependent protein deacylase [Evtepia sp.]